MDTLAQNQSRNYRFNFWKDKFWIWVLVLPFGLIIWIMPFVLFFGLLGTKNSPVWFPLFGFIFLGIPAYWIGWIFVYSVMEYIYTKVTITENWISIRLPWLLFPILPVVKRIEINQIHRANFFARYGSRIAIFLYYLKENKERKFYIPRFQYDPAYQREISMLHGRINPALSQANSVNDLDSNMTKIKMETLNKGTTRPYFRPSLFEKLLNFLIFVLIAGIFAISSWITYSIPPGGITSIEIGFSTASIFILLGLVGLVPVIGQVLFWFFGRIVINSVSGFVLHYSPDLIRWHTPEPINKVLGFFNIQPFHATFTDFLFWSIFLLSFLISMVSTIGWFKRKSFNAKD